MIEPRIYYRHSRWRDKVKKQMIHFNRHLKGSVKIMKAYEHAKKNNANVLVLSVLNEIIHVYIIQLYNRY